MKNHRMVNGRLLQTNKKWSALKGRQHTWISEVTKEEHAAFVAAHGKLPMKKNKLEVIDRIYARIDERGIWIPYGEMKVNVGKKLDKLNHASPLFVPPKPKPGKPPKPRVPQSSLEEFTDEQREPAQDEFHALLHHILARQIWTEHKAPSPKMGKHFVTLAMKQFQARHLQAGDDWKLSQSAALRDLYDETVRAVSEAYENETLPFVLNKGLSKRLNMQPFVLETERLILRRLSNHQFDALKTMLADPEVMAAWEHPFSDEEITGWITAQKERYRETGAGYYAAVLKETGEIVGQIGLLWSEIEGKQRLEVAYILQKAYWHRGLASEGARACVAYAFQTFGVKAVYAAIRPENAPSAAVAERIGMKRVGQFVKVYQEKSMPHDLYRIEP
ncbi:MAG: GNAT family N-acetyltransferase [Ethanoligenens sp.]